MLKIARERAEYAGVSEHCSFELGDFLTYPLPEPFDYAIVMGFMDYVSDPRAIIERVLDIVRVRAFFSFPKAGGPLAWQRQWRYRNRCDLFLYREEQIRALLAPTGASFTIDPIGRDFFVTLGPRPWRKRSTPCACALTLPTPARKREQQPADQSRAADERGRIVRAGRARRG